MSEQVFISEYVLSAGYDLMKLWNHNEWMKNQPMQTTANPSNIQHMVTKE
jgi:hypothetical protein